MNTNPQSYVLITDSDTLDPEKWEVFSNLDYGKEQASKRAEAHFGYRQVIYKLVPVYAAYLKVTTEVIVSNLEPRDDRRDWDEADRQEAERSK